MDSVSPDMRDEKMPTNETKHKKEDCPQDDRITDLERETKGHDKSLYGLDGITGIARDVGETKTCVKTISKQLFTSDGQVRFMPKISMGVWLPVLIILASSAIGTGYLARNAASKEDFAKTKTEVEAVKEDVQEIKDEMKATRQKVNSAVEKMNTDMKDAMKEQKETIQRENKMYYDNLKQLIESFHKPHTD